VSKGQAVVSEQVEWSLVRDLRPDDVVRLNYSATSHYFGVDTRPEPTGALLANACRGDMPEVEFWQTEMDRDMNTAGESMLQTVNGNARVQVLAPRPPEPAGRKGGSR
jgi:hypothetical protein